jgi:hypothetical protein
MPGRNIIDFEIGHNEETFEFFTRLAKEHKAKVLKQNELMKDVPSIEKLDITEVHNIIRKADNERQ